MNGTHDTHVSTVGEDGDRLDPHDAARLLERTSRDAQRQFGLSSPQLSVLAAAVVLVALGAVWLSVRGQHPYTGPTGAGLGVMYGALAGWIAAVVTFRRRAMTGLTGRSVRQSVRTRPRSWRRWSASRSSRRSSGATA